MPSFDPSVTEALVTMHGDAVVPGWFAGQGEVREAVEERLQSDL